MRARCSSRGLERRNARTRRYRPPVMTVRTRVRTGTWHPPTGLRNSNAIAPWTMAPRPGRANLPVPPRTKLLLGTGRARTGEAAAGNAACEAKRDAGGDERETKEEAREVAARGHAEMLERFLEFSHEERPRGACAVDLVEERRPGTEHAGSVARTRSEIEGELARPLSEFVP